MQNSRRQRAVCRFKVDAAFRFGCSNVEIAVCGRSGYIAARRQLLCRRQVVRCRHRQIVSCLDCLLCRDVAARQHHIRSCRKFIFRRQLICRRHRQIVSCRDFLLRRDVAARQRHILRRRKFGFRRQLVLRCQRQVFFSSGLLLHHDILAFCGNASLRLQNFCRQRAIRRLELDAAFFRLGFADYDVAALCFRRDASFVRKRFIHADVAFFCTRYDIAVLCFRLMKMDIALLRCSQNTAFDLQCAGCKDIFPCFQQQALFGVKNRAIFNRHIFLRCQRHIAGARVYGAALDGQTSPACKCHARIYGLELAFEGQRLILREISHTHIQAVLVDPLDLERSRAACAKVHGESCRGVCDQVDIAHKPCRFVCRPHIRLAERVFLRQYLNGAAGFSCRTDGKGRVLGCVKDRFLRVRLRDCIRRLNDDGLSFQAAVCEVGVLGAEIYLVRTNVRKGWCIAAFAEFYRAVFVRHIHRAVRISRPNRPQHEIAVLFSFERDFRRRFSIDRCAVAQDSDSRTVCADAAACRKANAVSGAEIGRSCSQRRFHADRARCMKVDVLACRDCPERENLRSRLLQIDGRFRVRPKSSAEICFYFRPFPADVAFAAVKRQVFRRDASFCRDAVSCQQLDFVRPRVDAAFDAQRLALGACQIDVSRAVCRDAAVFCRLHRERCLLPHGQTDESAGCVIVLRDIARSRFRERLEAFRAREICLRNGLFPGRTDIFRVQHDAAAADVRRFLKVHFTRTAVDDSIFHSV